jgi:hypothetical protein
MFGLMMLFVVTVARLRDNKRLKMNSHILTIFEPA